MLKGLESNLDFISSRNLVKGECLVNLYHSIFSHKRISPSVWCYWG